MSIYDECWKPHGESFDEYCGGAGDCGTCPIGDRCGMRASVEAELEDEDDEVIDESTCGSCVHYKDYKCGDEKTIKMCECEKCLFQSKR